MFNPSEDSFTRRRRNFVFAGRKTGLPVKRGCLNRSPQTPPHSLSARFRPPLLRFVRFAAFRADRDQISVLPLFVDFLESRELMEQLVMLRKEEPDYDDFAVIITDPLCEEIASQSRHILVGRSDHEELARPQGKIPPQFVERLGRLLCRPDQLPVLVFGDRLGVAEGQKRGQLKRD